MRQLSPNRISMHVLFAFLLVVGSVLCLGGVAVRNYRTAFDQTCKDVYESSMSYYTWDVCYDGQKLYHKSGKSAQLWSGDEPGCSNAAATGTSDILGECQAGGGVKYEEFAKLPSPHREAQVVTRFSSNECLKSEVTSVSYSYTTCNPDSEYHCQRNGDFWETSKCHKKSLVFSQVNEEVIVGTNIYFVVAVTVLGLIGLVILVLMFLTFFAVKAKKE